MFKKTFDECVEFLSTKQIFARLVIDACSPRRLVIDSFSWKFIEREIYLFFVFRMVEAGIAHSLTEKQHARIVNWCRKEIDKFAWRFPNHPRFDQSLPSHEQIDQMAPLMARKLTDANVVAFDRFNNEVWPKVIESDLIGKMRSCNMDRGFIYDVLTAKAIVFLIEHNATQTRGQLLATCDMISKEISKTERKAA